MRKSRDRTEAALEASVSGGGLHSLHERPAALGARLDAAEVEQAAEVDVPVPLPSSVSAAVRGRRPQCLGRPVHGDLHVGRVELGEHRVPLAVRHGDVARQFQDAVALDRVAGEYIVT